VSEGENDGGDYAGERKRKNDLAKRAPRVCAEDARGGEEFWVEAFEEGDEWLYAERKAVEDAGDDEAAEGESERVAEEGEPEFAERSARAHGDEEIETEDGGRRTRGRATTASIRNFGRNLEKASQ